MLSGLALSVEWPRHAYPDAGTVYYYYFHLAPQTVPANHSWIPGGTAYADAVQYGHATPSRVVRPFAVLIAGWERVFCTYGPLFGLIMLTGLGGVVRFRRTPGHLPRLVRSRRAGSMCCRSPAWPPAWPSPRPGTRLRRMPAPASNRAR